MIVKGITGQGFNGVLKYVSREDKDQSQTEILETNLCFGNASDIAKQMRAVANENTKATRPVLHIPISFDKKENVSDEKALQAIHEVLNYLGADENNNQWLIAKHTDTDTPHYHLVLNKVGFDESNISTDFIKKRLMAISGEVERKLNLEIHPNNKYKYDETSTLSFRNKTKEEMKAENMNVEKTTYLKVGKYPTEKKAISDTNKAITDTLADKSINDIEKFKSSLKTQNIDVKTMENKNGIYGISFKKDEFALKGTSVGYKWNDIAKELEKNKSFEKTQENKQKEELKIKANTPQAKAEPKTKKETPGQKRNRELLEYLEELKKEVSPGINNIPKPNEKPINKAFQEPKEEVKNPKTEQKATISEDEKDLKFKEEFNNKINLICNHTNDKKQHAEIERAFSELGFKKETNGNYKLENEQLGKSKEINPRSLFEFREEHRNTEKENSMLLQKKEKAKEILNIAEEKKGLNIFQHKGIDERNQKLKEDKEKAKGILEIKLKQHTNSKINPEQYYFKTSKEITDNERFKREYQQEQKEKQEQNQKKGKGFKR